MQKNFANCLVGEIRVQDFKNFITEENRKFHRSWQKYRYKMLNEWNTYIDEAIVDEDFEDYKYDKDTDESSEIKNLTEEETTLLRKYVRALESTDAVDQI